MLIFLLSELSFALTFKNCVERGNKNPNRSEFFKALEITSTYDIYHSGRFKKISTILQKTTTSERHAYIFQKYLSDEPYIQSFELRNIQEKLGSLNQSFPDTSSHYKTHCYFHKKLFFYVLVVEKTNTVFSEKILASLLLPARLDFYSGTAHHLDDVGKKGVKFQDIDFEKFFLIGGKPAQPVLAALDDLVPSQAVVSAHAEHTYELVVSIQNLESRVRPESLAGCEMAGHKELLDLVADPLQRQIKTNPLVSLEKALQAIKERIEQACFEKGKKRSHSQSQ